MATPTLRAIRAGFPQAELFAICRPVVAKLLDNLLLESGQPVLDQVLTFDKRSTLSRIGLSIAIRKVGLDSVIILPNSWWSAAVSLLAGTKSRVGYARDARRWMLTDAVPVRREAGEKVPVSPVDYYLALAKWVGCETHDRRMRLGVSESDRCAARELWADLRWDESCPTLVINNNAATQADRMWPADRVLDLAKYVSQTHHWQVLLHCGPAEMQAADAIARRADDPLIGSMAVAKSLPIGLTKSVMQSASVVVSTDSGPRHVAIALDRPVVSLFAAIDPAWTKTYNIPEVTVIPKSNDARSMQDIPLESVIAAFEIAMKTLTIAA